MSVQLTKSPLVYALVEIKISPILEIEKYIPKVQEVIRKEFPLFKKINIQTIEVRSSIDQPEIRTINQWHFANKSSTIGVLIGVESVMFHTSLYTSFDEIRKNLNHILEKIKTELDITLCTRIGIRYVNFISSSVEKYIKKELQGFFVNDDRFKKEYITKTNTDQETEIGFLKIQSSHISNKKIMLNSGQKNIFVPSELSQSADFLSFDDHIDKEPKNDYLILDIDHFSQKRIDFSVEEIINNVKLLHKDLYFVFKNAISEAALSAWK